MSDHVREISPPPQERASLKTIGRDPGGVCRKRQAGCVLRHELAAELVASSIH